MENKKLSPIDIVCQGILATIFVSFSLIFHMSKFPFVPFMYVPAKKLRIVRTWSFRVVSALEQLGNVCYDCFVELSKID